MLHTDGMYSTYILNVHWQLQTVIRIKIWFFFDLSSIVIDTLINKYTHLQTFQWQSSAWQEHGLEWKINELLKWVLLYQYWLLSHYCLLSFKNGFNGSIKMMTPDTFPCFKYILAKSGDKGFDSILIIKKIYLGWGIWMLYSTLKAH